MVRETNPIKQRSKYITSLPLLMLCMPVIIFLFVFHYIPIFGIIVAFQDFSYRDGFLSKFVGLDNFRFFFESSDAWVVIRNTVLYHFWFHILSTVTGIILAILFFEINSRGALKYFQSIMALPSILSWVIIAYIVYAVLSYKSGVANTILNALGMESIEWYNQAKYWPAILSIVSVWQGVGMGCLLYYAAFMGIDGALFEAAELDGAGRIRQIWHIMMPAILPIVSIMAIMSVGSVMSGNMGLFYQVPMDSPALYSRTDIITTYLLRGLKTGSMGVTAAVGLFQSVTGSILLLVTNAIVRKISPDNAMF